MDGLRFEAALRADPDSAVAFTGLGAALMSERFGHSGEPSPEDLAASERVAARALAIAPNNTVALINWANVLLFRGQPDVALPVYEKAMLRSPSNANARLRYATALQLNGRAAEMQPHIDSAMRIGYRDSRIMASAYFVASNAAFTLEDDEKAYALARRSLAERPNFGLSYASLASIDALHGRQADADRNMAEHRKLMPHNTIERYVRPTATWPAATGSSQACAPQACRSDSVAFTAGSPPACGSVAQYCLLNARSPLPGWPMRG
jgi:tetratricopeptide (TPR) repeat protein